MDRINIIGIDISKEEFSNFMGQRRKASRC